MSRIAVTVRSQIKASAVLAQIKKPLRKKLDELCAQRGEDLDTLARNDAVMAQVFSDVWGMFPSDVRSQVDQSFFVQSCLKEKYRLISELKEGKPKKLPLLERLRQKKAQKP
jgi:hypothetical protein